MHCCQQAPLGSSNRVASNRAWRGNVPWTKGKKIGLRHCRPSTNAASQRCGPVWQAVTTLFIANLCADSPQTDVLFRICTAIKSVRSAGCAYRDIKGNLAPG